MDDRKDRILQSGGRDKGEDGHVIIKLFVTGASDPFPPRHAPSTSFLLNPQTIAINDFETKTTPIQTSLLYNARVNVSPAPAPRFTNIPPGVHPIKTSGR